MLIIGAGPAGLACGIAASRYEKTVVLEKNPRPGVKLRMAGSGQCNLTHGGPVESFLQRYGDPKKARFVKPALFSFTNDDTVDFFEDRDLPLVERGDGKVFPESLRSDDVLGVMLAELRKNGGTLRTEIVVREVKRIDGGFRVETDSETFFPERLTIATGGFTYPTTGSTGDGYGIAGKLGHRIVSPRPALAPVVVVDYPFADSAGHSFKNVPVDLYRDEKKIEKSRGDVLLTHHGLSGPGILDLSRYVESGDTLRIPLGDPSVDLEPLLVGKKLLRNALAPFGVPERLLQQLFVTLEIPADISTSEVGRPMRNRLKDALTGFSYRVLRLGRVNEAMVTAGGVALDEVNRQTMESRLVPGLFFCGEVLDVDGDCGGYNIQFALSSGFLAGSKR